MGGSNWITNSFSLFFAQSPYSFVGQKKTWKDYMAAFLFFTFIFHDCVRLLRWAPVRPFLRNFAMFVLNLMTVSGCGNHIYMRWHANSSSSTTPRSFTKMNVCFFIFSFRVYFIIPSRSVFFSHFFFVLDSCSITGDLKCSEKKWLASADLAVSQPTPL